MRRALVEKYPVLLNAVYLFDAKMPNLIILSDFGMICSVIIRVPIDYDSSSQEGISLLTALRQYDLDLD